MFQSKDGKKKFGSKFVADRYDTSHSEDGMHKLGEGRLGEGDEHEAKESPEFEAGEKEGMDESHDHDSHEAAEQEALNEEHPAVAEHGKAHKVVISHDEQSGRHTVTSHHKDGHMHSMVHENAAKAHHEAKRLAGVPADGQDEEHDSPYHSGKAQAGASSEEDGFAMPDLA